MNEKAQVLRGKEAAMVLWVKILIATLVILAGASALACEMHEPNPKLLNLSIRLNYTK